MPVIRYHASNFSSSQGNHLQGTNKLNVSWADVVWSAITVGKFGFHDLHAFGHYSSDELRFRSFLVYANLMETGNQIYRSPVYDSLDSTEKGAVSFFIGMTIAKLFGAFLLNTPWLIHLEKLERIHNIGINGRSRPDLLGQDINGNWVIVEAKGRTNGFSQVALNKAKVQTQMVRHISGIAPSLRVATESFFDPYLEVQLMDPEQYSEDAYDIEIGLGSYLNTYYQPMISLLQSAKRKEDMMGMRYSFFEFENVGVSIGFNDKLFAKRELIKNEPLQFVELQRDIFRKAGIKENGVSLGAIYPDGIAIQLNDNWDPKKMLLSPGER